MYVKRVNPCEQNIHLNLGCIHEAMGKTNDAIKYYKKELILNPECPEALFNVGKALFKKRQFKRAIHYFEKCLQLKHSFDDVVVDLAFCYNKTRQIEKEIGLYKKCLQTNPSDSWCLQNLGAALCDVANYRRALYYLKRAKRLEPRQPIIDRNLKKVASALEKEKRKG